jgi:dTDP-4-amino-4,6-dideoxygalactose transaminase
MIRLTRPYIPEAAIEKCVEVLKSGNLVQGKYVEEFEQAISDYLGVRQVIVVSSGTAALHLALISLGIGRGDEVIIPAFSFPATANVVELVGAKPVFVDIKLGDFCIDVTLIENAITDKTKAIIPVHEFGMPANMNPIIKLADQYKLFIIEDAACALGAEYENRKVGTLGSIGCFSFHPRKAVTTGEGGVVVTNDALVAEKIIALRNHGIERISGITDFNYAGFNYRLTDFQAVLGLYQFLEIETLINRRIEIAEYYQDKLADLEGIVLPKVFVGRKSAYQSFHILVEGKIDRNDLKARLYEMEVETNYGANSLVTLNFYKKKYNPDDRKYTNSIIAHTRGLTLPMSHLITEQELSIVTDSFKSILENG